MESWISRVDRALGSIHSCIHSCVQAHEAVLKLRDNLRAEQHVVLEFAIAVFRGVFKPWQMATLLVKCYPAVPDALGIASALAVELGEPDMPMTRQLTLQLGGYLGESGGLFPRQLSIATHDFRSCNESKKKQTGLKKRLRE